MPIRLSVVAVMCHTLAAGCAASPLRHLGRQDEHAVSAAFSPADEYVVAGDTKGIVRVYDTRSGRELARQSGFVWSRALGAKPIAFSPDGALVAFATSSGVRVWVWQSEKSRDLNGLKSTPQAVAFMNDRRIAALSGGYVYDSGEQTATRQPLVISTWDVETGALLSHAEDETSGALTSTFAPDATSYAANCFLGMPQRFDQMTAQSDVRPQLRLCDTTTGQAFAVTDMKLGAWYMSYSPDGKLLFTSLLGGPEAGAVRDGRTADVLHTVDFHQAVFSADGDTLISLTYGRRGASHPVHLLLLPIPHEVGEWQLVTLDLKKYRQRERRIRPREDGQIGSSPVAFSNDRSIFVDPHLRLWRVPR